MQTCLGLLGRCGSISQDAEGAAIYARPGPHRRFFCRPRRFAHGNRQRRDIRLDKLHRFRVDVPNCPDEVVDADDVALRPTPVRKGGGIAALRIAALCAGAVDVEQPILARPGGNCIQPKARPKAT